mgnify:CR=1 FL=1
MNKLENLGNELLSIATRIVFFLKASFKTKIE